MKIVGIYNIKGGVGKTACAVNIAHLAALEGARVLVWDLDPQGAASFYFRVKPKIKGGTKALFKGKSEVDDLIKGTDFENLDLLPADFSYRRMDILLDSAKKPTKLRKILEPLADDYDYIFLDCPPGISLVSENIFRAVDALVIPLIPTTLSLRTYEQLLDFCTSNGFEDIRLWPFFSMAEMRKRLHRDIIERLPREKLGFLKAIIPHASDVEKMGLKRTPLAEYAPSSRAAGAYRELWREIKRRLK
jgi:cellulose biosynthesis protein BcsQ